MAISLKLRLPKFLARLHIKSSEAMVRRTRDKD
jgi:hypothetical protein